ncbi:transcriptional regulator [Bacteroidales bacterium]|nr:transcriptional regulator [Bacteroidales bacterium]
MKIQQLEYVIALDNYRHFAKAAEACGVTQPTLSMMIQKLEEEIDVKIFDRSTFPIAPSPLGQKIIAQARICLQQFDKVREIVESEQDRLEGTFNLAIIPTIAPYIVPELLMLNHSSGSSFELVIKESTTDQIVESILNGSIDGGLMAGPLNHPKLKEYPLYYEKFYAYVSAKDSVYGEKEIDLSLIDINSVWLLENVHCFSGQIQRLCKMKKNAAAHRGSKYEAGSIDTLINIVDYNGGITVIPEMSTMGLSEERQENLRPFKGLTAVREVSLVVSCDYVRERMLAAVMDLVKASVPKSMQNPGLKEFVVDI